MAKDLLISSPYISSALFTRLLLLLGRSFRPGGQSDIILGRGAETNCRALLTKPSEVVPPMEKELGRSQTDNLDRLKDHEGSVFSDPFS